jgi:hypothetical protein
MPKIVHTSRDVVDHICDELGITAAELGRRAGIGPSTVCNLRQKRYRALRGQAIQLAMAAGYRIALISPGETVINEEQ